MPWTRPALLLTLTWALRPCVPARPEATALEVTPFAYTRADLEAEALVLHASAAGLAAERSRPIDLPFGRTDGPQTPVDWCAVPVVLPAFKDFDLDTYVVIDVDDGVPYEGFVRLLDAVTLRGARRVLLAGGPAEEGAPLCAGGVSRSPPRGLAAGT